LPAGGSMEKQAFTSRGLSDGCAWGISSGLAYAPHGRGCRPVSAAVSAAAVASAAAAAIARAKTAEAPLSVHRSSASQRP